MQEREDHALSYTYVLSVAKEMIRKRLQSPQTQNSTLPYCISCRNFQAKARAKIGAHKGIEDRGTMHAQASSLLM